MTLREKAFFVITLILVAVVLFAVFSVLSRSEPDELFQVSPFNVFSLGNFDGNTTYAELAKHGDFGIGTLNGLNGEMFAVDGKFYQIPVDGAPRQIEPSELAPYATVTFFENDQTFEIANISSYAELTAAINSTLPNQQLIYAISVHGLFDSIKTRSVPMQTKPYPTITEAVKNQTEFNLEAVEGTLVGFYFPASMSGVDAVGYHLHFLTDNHTAGGHVLECKIDNAVVEIDWISNYHLLIQ